MLMVGNIVEGLDKVSRKLADPVNVYLDKHPKIYKVYIFAMHMFRSTLMFALVAVSPLPIAVTTVLMAGASFLYYAGVEKKFCNFKFTIPSAFGGMAFWMTKAAIIKIMAGAAFASLGGFLTVTGAVISLAFYTSWVYYLTNRDIKNYFDKKNLPSSIQGSCCL